jgi:hypothetical protein
MELRSRYWESLCLDAANQFRLKLVERDKERFDKWNEIAREVKKVTVPLVLKKTKGVVDANHLPQVLVNTVQWDILHLCMEAEYADVFPPGFFASLLVSEGSLSLRMGWRASERPPDSLLNDVGYRRRGLGLFVNYKGVRWYGKFAQALHCDSDAVNLELWF